MIRILFILICFFSIQQDKPTIVWQQDYKLSWDDFKAKPRLSSDAVAETASGISFGFSVKEFNKEIVSFSTDVFAYFYPEESWCKPKDVNRGVLAHEQLHFDLTELYSRKLKHNIAKLEVSKDIKKELRWLYQNTVKALDIAQKQYDAETNHSQNIDIQKHWEAFVEEELRKLSNYK